MKKEDDEITFDFSRIAKIFRKDSNDSKSAGDKKPAEEEELTLDFKKAGSFLYKYRMVFLLLIPLILGFYVRILPAYIPATDQWADSSVQNYYRTMIAQQVNQRYPNLPADNKNSLINTELSKLISEQKDVYEQQVKQTSQQFKEHFKDESGQVYLNDIDSYYYYRQARNIVENGGVGDKVVDGKEFDDHTLFPIGANFEITLHPYLTAWLYKTMHFFNPKASVMGAAFYLTVILAVLSIIPVFFIVRRIAGDFGGLFAALVIAIHPNFAAKTMAGFADTDVYNVFFPLLIIWLFLEAFVAKDRKKSIIFSGLAGIIVGVYSFTWGGWWHVFDFILYAVVAYIAYLVISKYLHNKKEVAAFIKGEEFKSLMITIIVFLISSGIVVSLANSFGSFVNAPLGPLKLATLKQAAHETLWPNVYTTVAELNEASIGSIVDAIGGEFLLWLALVGVILAFSKLKNNMLFIGGSALWFLFVLLIQPLNQHPIIFVVILGLPMLAGVLLSLYEKNIIDIKLMTILTVWMLGSIFAGTKGIRFVLLMVPPFAIGIGIAVGLIYKYLSDLAVKELHINRIVVKAVFIILFLLLVGISPIPPFCKHGMCQSVLAIGNGEVPMMNDAWHSSLVKIKNNSTEDNAVINSWWDFGHWFKAVADRPVTFDGSSQNTPQAHWIGKTLLTNDEEQAIGILRMLDCGGNTAFDILNNETKNFHLSVDTIYKIIVLNKDEAKEVLLDYVPEDTAGRILEKTHCAPPEDFFITSEDMVGKAGVWAHFGSWDFEKAKMWVESRKLDSAEGVKFIKKEFGYSDEEAERIYSEIESIGSEEEANSWISSWPSYVGSASCQKISNTTIRCIYGLQGQNIPIKIDLTDFSAVIESQEKLSPKSMSYVDGGEFKVKYFNTSFPYSITLIQEGDSYASIMMFPELVDSMFTRLFYHGGVGLKHFDFFDHQMDITGLDIYVWTVNWEGKKYEPQKNTEGNESSSVKVVKSSKESDESSVNATDEE